MRKEISSYSKIPLEIIKYWKTKEIGKRTVEVVVAGAIEIFYIDRKESPFAITNNDILAQYDGQKVTYFWNSYLGTHYSEMEYIRLLKMKAFI
jgi:hypothetical protein